MKKQSISFYTLGCRLNQSETASVKLTFALDGYNVVDISEPADMVVINTCTVTENGDADTRRLVHKVKRINPKTRIALIGCQAQVQKEKLASLPNVHWIVGNARKMELKVIVENLKDGSSPHIITPTIPRDSFTIDVPAIDQRRTRANLKIQDGCDFFCSFCEIPYARGRARSREFENIILEAKALVAAGHKELVITGINVGTYKNNKKNIVDVVEALEAIKGLERIRISSIEPTTAPRKLIKKMAQKSKLCRYLHIPLQSGHDSVLRAMKRKYTVQEFSNFIQHSFDAVDGICIGTDIIVGFPTEKEEYFLQSAQKLKELPLHYFHVFSYSPRYMAKANKLVLALCAHEIKKRSKILRDLSLRKRRMFHESLIGTTQKVLFEQKKNGFWVGLTDNYVRVKVKSEENLSNKFLDVKLKKNDHCAVHGSIT